MPEAAEAQLKIANIHYQQMEKPDRDYTHAMRAEEEYRQLILQYPDNKKVVEEGKQRLLEVQEVIAEREFRVGRFYLSAPVLSRGHRAAAILDGQVSAVQRSRRGAVSFWVRPTKLKSPSCGQGRAGRLTRRASSRNLPRMRRTPTPAS